MADGRTWQDKAMRCDAMQGWLEDDTFLMQQKMPSVNLNSRTTERDGDFSGGGLPKKKKKCAMGIMPSHSHSQSRPVLPLEA